MNTEYRQDIIDRAECEVLARRAAVTKMVEADRARAKRCNTATAAVAIGLAAMAVLLMTLWRVW